jgi:hypothetical protein
MFLGKERYIVKEFVENNVWACLASEKYKCKIEYF